MIILEQFVLSDGTLVRLEDWSVDYKCYSYGATVAAYPKKYARIRAEVDFENHTEAKSTFDKLVDGSLDIINVNFTIMERGGNRVPFAPVLKKFRRIADND